VSFAIRLNDCGLELGLELNVIVILVSFGRGLFWVFIVSIFNRVFWNM